MEKADKDWIDKLGEHIRSEEVTTKVFQRLHTLIQKGYVPDFHMEFVEAFWLNHPAKNFKHNILILYPSGLVISLKETADEFRFGLEDEHEFQRFLRKVPSPTVWDRVRMPLLNIWAIIVLYGGLLIFGLAFAYFIDALWSFIKRTFAS
jgi:hypothetical protein